ncbi:MAG: extracellular solute-binding protein [Bacteroidetes bacterium]|jgi:molybdate/tungstate transport system substrate-binding protein|nr:extracellular solute-binding protein [Bacteroidota bacterium]
MKLIKIAFFVVLSMMYSCDSSKSEAPLVIFHAGSLSQPLQKLAAAYQEINPTQQFRMEPAGSLNTIRKVTDLKRKADLIASADFRLIDEMLIPDYTTINIAFASNSMVLAYNESSQKSTEISTDNWIEILSDETIRIGASDPNSDPCGYRTRLSLQLAGKMHAIKQLDEQLLRGSRYHERPKETDLIALLETHTIDYFFIYESVAKQHGLSYLSFPDSINLSNADLNDWYKNASISVRGASPGESIQINGEAIIYGLTVLQNSSNTAAAWDFVAFILDPVLGGEILMQSGQKPIYPAKINTQQAVPEAIRNKTILLN